MNPVLILTHNCLELTKKCVESAKAQDIETVEFFFVDNASTDGTFDWIGSPKIIRQRIYSTFRPNRRISRDGTRDYGDSPTCLRMEEPITSSSSITTPSSLRGFSLPCLDSIFPS